MAVNWATMSWIYKTVTVVFVALVGPQSLSGRFDVISDFAFFVFERT